MSPDDEIKALRAALHDCATRFHSACALGGSARWACEGSVKEYFALLGKPLPPWPAGLPEDGTDDDESDEEWP